MRKVGEKDTTTTQKGGAVQRKPALETKKLQPPKTKPKPKLKAEEVDTGELFPGTDTTASPSPAPTAKKLSLLELRSQKTTDVVPKKSEAANDDGPPARLVDRHIQVILKKSEYSDDRRKEWQSTPEDVRRHPKYVRALAEDDYHYADWLKDPDDRAALTKELADTKWVATLKHALSLAPLMPEATLQNAALRKKLMDSVKSYSPNFSSLPESLRTDAEFVKFALEDHYTLVAHVPLDKAPKDILKIVEDASIAYLADGGDLKKVPASIRATPGLLERAIKKTPLLWNQLDAAEKGRLEKLFEDPKLAATAAPLFAEKFTKIWYSDRKPEHYTSAPAGVRNHEVYQRTSLAEEPKVVEWGRLTAERMDELFTGPKSTDKVSGYKLHDIAKQLLRKTLERPHVRATVLEGLKNDAGGLAKLPDFLRADPEMIKAACKRSVLEALQHAKLAGLPAEVIGQFEDLWIKQKKEYGHSPPDWAKLPPDLAGSISFAKKIVRAWPSIEVPEAMRAQLGDVLDDPAVIKAAVDPWLRQMKEAYYKDKRAEMYAATPLAVRRHPDYARGLLTDHVPLIEKITDPADRKEIEAAMRDVAFLTHKETPLTWLTGILPAEVLEKKAIKNEVARRIKENDARFSDLPEVLRSDAGIIRAALEKSSYSIRHVPMPAADAPSFELVRDAWLEHVKDSGSIEATPPELLGDAKFQAGFLIERPTLYVKLTEDQRKAGAAILRDPKFYEALLEYEKGVSDLAKAVSPAEDKNPVFFESLLASLAKHPYSYKELPEALQRDDRVIKAALDADPGIVNYVPIDQISPRSLARAKKAGQKYIDDTPHYWGYLNAKLRADPEFVLAQVTRHPDLLGRLKEGEVEHARPLLSDPAFLEKTGTLLFELWPKLAKDVTQDPRVVDAILKLVEKQPGYYKNLPADLQLHTRAIVAKVVADGYFRDELPAAARTDENIRAVADRGTKLLGGLKREDVSDALFGDLEAKILAGVPENPSMGNVPSLFDQSLPIRKKVLELAGLKGFDSYGDWKLLLDPELWKGAPRPLIREFLEKNPERFEIVAAEVGPDPELVSLAFKKGDAKDRAAIMQTADPILWTKVDFVESLMAIDPVLYHRASEELRSDPERAERAIRAHPANIDFALIDHQTLLGIYRRLDFSAKNGAWNEDSMLSTLGYSPDSKEVDLRTPDFAAFALAKVPKRASELRPDLLADEEFVTRLARTTPNALSAWPLASMPADARAKIETVLRREAAQRPEIYKWLPEDLRKDRFLLDQVIDKNPEAITHAVGELAHDVDLWKRALDQDALLITKSSRKETLKQHAIDAAILQIRDRKIHPKAIPEFLYQASQDIAFETMRAWGGHGVAWFNSWLKYDKGQDIVRQLLRMDPQKLAAGLDKVPPELVRVLEMLPRDRISGGPDLGALRFALALADLKPALATQLPPFLGRHPKVKELAWSIDPPAGAVLAVFTEEERKSIIQKRPSALTELPMEQRTPELVLAAVTLEGAYLRQAPDESKDNFDVVRAAVASHGAALQYASERLRRDPEIVAAAVRNDPKSIQYSQLTGSEARASQILAVREGGLIDDRLEKLRDQDFVLAFAAHLADQHYQGNVSIQAQFYRFEHHFDDPDFAAQYLEHLPNLKALPEKYWTPENLFTVAKRSSEYFDSNVDPRLDPRSLAPELWTELAAAHPLRFVRHFTADKIPAKHHAALEKALLAAVHQDHDAASRLPDSWWKSPELVAKLLDANPFVLLSLGPSQMRVLRELQPGVVERAQEFLSRVRESGFQLKRFDGKFPLLKELIQNRYERNKDDPRPIAVVVYPKDDHNGAFNTLKFDKLVDNYRVMYYEAGSANEMAAAIRNGTTDGKAHLVMLAAHGSPESLQWGNADQRPDQPSHLRPEHTTMVAEQVPAERLAQDAKVVFHACSVGGGGKFRRNLVNCLADVWPHVWLQAAWFDSSAGNRLVYHDDGTFARMDFRNAATLRAVPYHIAAPKRHDYGPTCDPLGRGIE